MEDISRLFEVCVSQTLSKNEIMVRTDQYEVKDIERDENDTEFVDYTTENVNWEEEYNKQHLTPLNLISILSSICTGLIEEKGIHRIGEYDLRTVKKECDGWINDNTVIMEEYYGHN